MAKEKQPNYTPEQTQELRDVYVALMESGADYETRKSELEAFAAKTGRKARSLVSKISRMDDENGDSIYVKKVAVSKISGEPAEKKDALSVEVAESVNQFIDNPTRKINPENLVKLNKTDLLGFRDAFNALNPSED